MALSLGMGEGGSSFSPHLPPKIVSEFGKLQKGIVLQ